MLLQLLLGFHMTHVLGDCVQKNNLVTKKEKELPAVRFLTVPGLLETEDSFVDLPSRMLAIIQNFASLSEILHALVLEVFHARRSILTQWIILRDVWPRTKQASNALTALEVHGGDTRTLIVRMIETSFELSSDD
jgi:hypothetical protein